MFFAKSCSLLLAYLLLFLGIWLVPASLDASEPVLYFQEGDRLVRVVKIEDRVFYYKEGEELRELTHAGDSGSFILKGLPDDLLSKVYVPPRVELMMGPREAAGQQCTDNPANVCRGDSQLDFLDQGVRRTPRELPVG